MPEKTLNDLFLDTLKDIYFAEKQIVKALPKMARAAQSEEGKAGFLQHRDETEGQIERLEQMFELIGKSPRGKTCEAIQELIAEGEEIMEEYKGTAALDAGLISSAQAVEHYEIARYGALKSWAAQLGLDAAVASASDGRWRIATAHDRTTKRPCRWRLHATDASHHPFCRRAWNLFMRQCLGDSALQP
nr:MULTISPECIES: ferritin-like domain-containing protein [unclassified Ensifer]